MKMMTEQEIILPLLIAVVPILTIIFVFIFHAGKTKGKFEEHERRITNMETNNRKTIISVFDKINELSTTIAKIEAHCQSCQVKKQ